MEYFKKLKFSTTSMYTPVLVFILLAALFLFIMFSHALNITYKIQIHSEDGKVLRSFNDARCVDYSTNHVTYTDKHGLKHDVLVGSGYVTVTQSKE